MNTKEYRKFSYIKENNYKKILNIYLIPDVESHNPNISIHRGIQILNKGDLECLN